MFIDVFILPVIAMSLHSMQVDDITWAWMYVRYTRIGARCIPIGIVCCCWGNHALQLKQMISHDVRQ